MTALEVALRLSGVSLLVVSGLHGFFWRVLEWGPQSRRLSKINARVFTSHIFFIAFVLAAQGTLLVVRPSLLVERTELARLVLWAFTLFFGLRLVAQPFFFDPVLPVAWPARTGLRIAASVGWLGYVAVFAAALVHQYA